jgi:hypothetical protein
MRKRSLDPRKTNIPVQHLCSRKEFYAFALNSVEYQGLHANWVESNFEFSLIPTVDRIDNLKGYLINNIQFITHAKNVAKGNREVDRGAGNHKKRVSLEKDGVKKYFLSGKSACDFLGLGYAAVANAIHKGRKIKDWLPSYVW